MSDWNFLNRHRVRTGLGASDDSFGFNGYFCAFINGLRIKMIASDGAVPGSNDRWQHVSVSIADSIHTPSWAIMCKVKDLFWEPEDVVVQFHPRASEYVSHHPGCLHLWRPLDREMPTPPPIMVGPKVTGAQV